MHTLTHRVLPGLNTLVSTIGAGCWTIGGPANHHGVPIGWDAVDEEDAFRGLVRAYELGINLFDTADVYGFGRSERLLGRLLHEFPRDDLVLSSKVGYFAGTGRHPYEPRQVRHQLATTLDNLNTDHLDLYLLHSTDFGIDDRYFTSTIELLQKFRDQGLIRAFGLRAPHVFAEQWAGEDSSRGAATRRWLKLFHSIMPSVLTVRHNLLSPLYSEDETDIFAFARRHQVGVLIKQALAQGRLVQHSRVPTFSTGDHRSADPEFLPEQLQRLNERLAPLRGRFGDRPHDMVRMALRYVLQHAPDAAVLVGFRNAAQISSVTQAIGEPLTDNEIAEIRALLHAQSDASGKA